MNTLAIETSTLTGSVAFVSDGKLVGETTLSVSVQHSERLMSAIDQLLRDAGAHSAEIDLYAVAVGPGSFTGLRIGIAAAQGLALAHSKPLIGVSTLEGLAMNGIYFGGVVVPVLNAFRNELYWRFDGEDKVSATEALIASLRETSGPTLFLGNGVPLCCDALVKELGDRVTIAPGWMESPRAVHIATLAGKKFENGFTNEPVLPRYLRQPG